jgi:hypothetical protein
LHKSNWQSALGNWPLHIFAARVEKLTTESPRTGFPNEHENCSFLSLRFAALLPSAERCRPVTHLSRHLPSARCARLGGVPGYSQPLLTALLRRERHPVTRLPATFSRETRRHGENRGLRDSDGSTRARAALAHHDRLKRGNFVPRGFRSSRRFAQRDADQAAIGN